MSFLPIFLILLPIMIIIIINITNKNEITKENKINKMMLERQLLINKFSDELSELYNIEKKLVENFFNIPICTKCGDTIFSIIKYNSHYNGVEIQCETCGKKTWLKSDDTDNYKLRDIKEKVINIETEAANRYIYLSDIKYSRSNIKSNIKFSNSLNTRHSIPKSVKQEVWVRDNGRCVQCGSKEKLEYDHIIPISRGGSNTVRNIQLLCEKCNRKKSNKIE